MIALFEKLVCGYRIRFCFDKGRLYNFELLFDTFVVIYHHVLRIPQIIPVHSIFEPISRRRQTSIHWLVGNTEAHQSSWRSLNWKTSLLTLLERFLKRFPSLKNALCRFDIGWNWILLQSWWNWVHNWYPLIVVLWRNYRVFSGKSGRVSFCQMMFLSLFERFLSLIFKVF